MNEEKIPNEEKLQEPIAENVDPQKKKTASIAKNEKSNSQPENSELANDIPSKIAQQSTATIANVSNSKEMIAKTAVDGEQMQEISSAHSWNLYKTEDEIIDMGYDYEYESEEEYTTTKSLAKNVELFDPTDRDAVKFKTDSASLIISKLPRLAPAEEETSMERLFNKAMFSEISLDTLSTPESFEPDTKVGGDDFFEKLGEVPDVKDITSGSIDLEDYRPRHYVRVGRLTLDGRFVHPLTGASIYSTIDEEEKEYQDTQDMTQAEEEEAEEEQEQEMHDYEFDDFDALYPEDPIEKALKTTQQDEQARMDDMFDERKLDDTKITFREFVVEEDIELKNNFKMVENFLEDIITRIIRFHEQKETHQVVRERLDKKLLFYEIEKLVKEITIEKQVHSFLSRKAVNYYRRKRQMRYIISEKPEVLAHEQEKYKEVAENLDAILGREIAINKKTKAKVENLFIEVDEMEEEEKAERLKFEALVKNTLKRENMPKLSEAIEKDLQKIALVAKEISQVRAVFISRQHMLGALKAQIDELENIGNGLRVADYETIEREIYRLERKIEDHNKDLDRLYLRFHSTIHTLAHSKLRNEMFVDRIKQQVNKLSILDEEQTSCRLTVFDLKKKRQRLQHNITDLSFQCGLLDKPAILVDYDRTMDVLQIKRKEVENLRETFKNLDQKLRRVEAACDQN